MTVIAGRYRRVAVKEVRFPDGLDADERSRRCRRAVREARAAGMLDHESPPWTTRRR